MNPITLHGDRMPTGKPNMADPKDLHRQDGDVAQPASEDAQEAPLVSTGISSGKPIDDAGGAGLGQPPGAGEYGSPSAPQSQEKTPADPQDQRNKS